MPFPRARSRSAQRSRLWCFTIPISVPTIVAKATTSVRAAMRIRGLACAGGIDMPLRHLMAVAAARIERSVATRNQASRYEAQFMNFHNDNQMALQKFGVGQPVPRNEDPKLVRGEGRYTDDVSLPGQAYAVMVRSTHAHGIIRNIDTAAARAMPGVLGIYTGADLTGYGGL